MKNYSFGNYICALRTGLGLSQFQLGALVGVTDKAVSKWENSGAKPRIATCYRLAEVLGVSINDLLSCKKQVSSLARKDFKRMNYRLWKEAYKRLSIYGDTPPVECLSRLAAEEAALQGYDTVQGFAVTGKIKNALEKINSTLIVTGTFNSSYTAWLFGATDVNPLPAHYRCPECGKVEFIQDAASGFDLPSKHCACGAEYIRDGHNIPFEGFASAARLGTQLEYRISEKALPVATKALLEFYEGKAYLLPVKMHALYDVDSSLEEDCATIEKVLTRYVILPESREKPALSEDGFWHVTSDEYWQWQDDETSFMFMLSDNFDEMDNLAEKTTLPIPNPTSLFTPEMIIKLFKNNYSMFADNISPSESIDFDLLVRLESFNHSTDVWHNNGENLVKSGAAAIRNIPATREDIWNTINAALIKNNIHSNGLATLAMERARKGMLFSQGIPTYLRSALSALELPEWYPQYLETVKYIFPKGHCIAILIINARLEWLKEHTK